MAIVLDLRGTHGSGKSHIVHTLLKRPGTTPIRHDGRVYGYHVPDIDCGIVGSYERTCGGCDTIKDVAEPPRRVTDLVSRFSRVVFEGILVAHSWKRYHALSVALEGAGHRYYFCFLDTPLNTCLTRVKQRRATAGVTGRLDPKHTVKDWYAIWGAIRYKAQAAGSRCVTLPHADPMPTVMDLLRG